MGAFTIALALGSNLAGNLLSNRSERARRQKLADMMRQDLAPLEEQYQTARAGLSRAEGGLVRATTNQSLSNLAERNVLDSSIAAGEVAQATAPVRERAQVRRDSLGRNIAAARTAISAVEEGVPGFGAAFGDSLQEAGGFLALYEGVKMGRNQQDQIEASGLENVFQEEGMILDGMQRSPFYDITPTNWLNYTGRA